MSDAADNHDHARWQGEAAAYALNALDQHELEPFERHLAGCEQCQRELAAMRTAVDALPALAPASSVPPGLKQLVMDTVHADLARQPPEAQERRPPPRRARPTITAPRWPIPGLAVAATAVIAVVAVLAVLTFAGSSGPKRTYAGIVSSPGASASVRVSGDSAILRFSGLPAPPPSRLYEVWLTRAQAPVPARALFTKTTGSVALPGSLHGVRTVLVTAEPRPSGSRAPTRAPIIVVRLS
ncbi:MAG: anti-sigma factor [Solirubrobacterales bacterium]|nr:anti-sigma factor [Solirubrobacterales bacterium]MBV9471445.1 anti-sigma factor [Solirubrobacterales bacterium]MBV9838865.1 anti-sigma factor [Solirubrobacterales bacterium]